MPVLLASPLEKYLSCCLPLPSSVHPFPSYFSLLSFLYSPFSALHSFFPVSKKTTQKSPFHPAFCGSAPFFVSQIQLAQAASSRHRLFRRQELPNTLIFTRESARFPHLFLGNKSPINDSVPDAPRRGIGDQQSKISGTLTTENKFCPLAASGCSAPCRRHWSLAPWLEQAGTEKTNHQVH